MHELPNKLQKVINILKEKKTESINILDISELSIISDYFIIVSMSNERGVNAIENDICDKMSESGYNYLRKEGTNTKWVLIDYGDIVIHIFDNEYNSIYNLQKLWADAKELKI